MKNIFGFSLFLYFLIFLQCTSIPKKDEIPQQPVSAAVAEPELPMIESAVAQRLAEMDAEEEMFVTVRPELVFRESPEKIGKVITGIPYGAKVIVLDRSRVKPHSKGKWYKISYQGKIGYVSGKYLRKPNKKNRAENVPEHHH